MSEWQPIETSPKDGTQVLTCYSVNGETCDYQVNHYNNTDGIAPGYRLGRKGWWCSAPHQQPTHWQPLSAP